MLFVHVGEVVADCDDNSPVFNVFDECIPRADGSLQVILFLHIKYNRSCLHFLSIHMSAPVMLLEQETGRDSASNSERAMIYK
jgi:hypothetical protein